jgi:hypothetical protein
MKLRNLCVAITLFCTPLMANAGLQELKGKLDQAEKSWQAARKNANAHLNRHPAQHYLTTGRQATVYNAIKAVEKAAMAASIARAAYNAACRKEHDSNREQAHHRMSTILNEIFQEKEENDHDHSHEIMTCISTEDASLTLTYDNGQEEELVGVLQIYQGGTCATAIFAQQTAHQVGANQFCAPFAELKDAADEANEAARKAMVHVQLYDAAKDHPQNFSIIKAVHEAARKAAAELRAKSDKANAAYKAALKDCTPKPKAKTTASSKTKSGLFLQRANAAEDAAQQAAHMAMYYAAKTESTRTFDDNAFTIETSIENDLPCIIDELDELDMTQVIKVTPSEQRTPTPHEAYATTITRMAAPDSPAAALITHAPLQPIVEQPTPEEPHNFLLEFLLRPHDTLDKN